MPINRNFREHYKPGVWGPVRRRILERAGGKFDEGGKYLGGAKCERCGVPDHRVVERRAGYWRPIVGASWLVIPVVRRWLLRGRWHDTFGAILRRLPEKTTKTLRVIRIILTVAHLNHDCTDNRDENLEALCQWCHFNHDQAHHKETRSVRKDEERPLLKDGD